MADVSVIIPVFNRGHRLQRAVESVLRQSEPVREIIIVDDGSTDRSVERLGVDSQTSGIPIICRSQENQGPAAARNHGIGVASGKFVAFLDSDDEWHAKKIGIQYNAMQSEPTVTISHTRERWLRNGTHLNQKAFHEPQGGDIFEQSLKLCCVGMSTVMAHTSLFRRYGQFDETLRCCEDYDLWLRISPFEPFLLIDQRLTVKHGGRADQVSAEYRQGMDRFRIQSLATLMVRTVLLPEKRDAVRQELQRRCAIYGNGCARHGKAAEAKFYEQLGRYDFSGEKL